MNRPAPWAARLGFDAFGTSVALALVVGALSVETASLRSLVGALAALALAGWSSTGPRLAGRSLRRSAALFAALGLLGTAAWVYLAPPAGADGFRGLMLALGLVPFWTLERARAIRASPAPEAG